jgi:hypothetical protein
MIGPSRFPDSHEDLIALSSLACLTHTLSVSGYAYESIRISEIITNYILYESCADTDGSFRKLCIAAAAEEISSNVFARHRAYAKSPTLPNDTRSEAAFLYNFIAFGDQDRGVDRNPGQLQSIFDYVSAAYHCLVTAQGKDQSTINSPRFSAYFRQLCTHMQLPPIESPKLVESLGDGLRVSTISALCQAAVTQLLHGIKGLAYNGDFIRQIGPSVAKLPSSGASNMIVDPIANLLALLLEEYSWSSLYDNIIIALIDRRVKEGCQWSYVNLALRRCEAAKRNLSPSLDESKVLASCSEFLHSYAAAWQSKGHSIINTCVHNGWLSLIRKSLWCQQLTSTNTMERNEDFDRQANTAFQYAAQVGHTHVMKRMVECVGFDYWKRTINQGNAQGLTAVHLACQYRAPKEIFRLLQLCGGDPNARCHAGRTPLIYCFPDQASLPSMYQLILDLISAHQLPTTAPLNKPKAWVSNRNCTDIDPRAYDFRVIVNHLLCRNANMTVVDNQGMTPLHHAAKEGWGDVLPVFFLHYHDASDDWQKQCLTMRDYNNRSALDHARMAGNRGDIQGGEDSIIAQMSRLQVAVPPKTNLAKPPLPDALITVTINRPRLPTPEPPPLSAYPAPRRTPVGAPSVALFPAPYVYQDRASLAESNLQLPPRFTPAQIYRDPAFASSATASLNTNTTPARQTVQYPQFAQPHVYSDPTTSLVSSTNSSLDKDSHADTHMIAPSRRLRRFQKFVGRK